ncbi:hypothetical protein CEXT_706551 [Caerostris extrusa]|uniref:Secreted protein n=1 Tax=Caerostris extrusa TaxID=172846 RepID=A0AAV4XRW6_CAEEX|nr:hypothetical protein CEXT_706551 [Caerostris extrusa]
MLLLLFIRPPPVARRVLFRSSDTVSGPMWVRPFFSRESTRDVFCWGGSVSESLLRTSLWRSECIKEAPLDIVSCLLFRGVRSLYRLHVLYTIRLEELGQREQKQVLKSYDFILH